MSVHLKSDGRWACVYYEEGKQRWEYFGRGRQGERNAKERDLEIRLEKKRRPREYFSSSTLTFFDLAQAYINARQTELKPRTRYEILYIVNLYADCIRKVPITSLTMEHASRIQEVMLKRQIKNRSANVYWHYFRKILDWAVDEPSIPLKANPWTRKKNLRTRHQRFQVELFRLDELQGIMAKAPDHLAWVLEVAYYTGVRPGPGELFALRWDQLNWDSGNLRVYAPKTNSWRTIPLDAAFLRHAKTRFKARVKTFPDCPWICHYKGKQLHSVKRSWGKAKADAGITRRIRLYDIRHYYITYALANGMDIMRLAELAGHTTPEMIIKVYAHLAKDLRSQKATKLPALHPGRKR